MKKIEDSEVSPEVTMTTSTGTETRADENHSGLPMDESAKFLFDVFERSVEKLEPVDKQLVLENQAKLMKSFTLLGEKITAILSSEEGRRLMQQELQNRERSKK